MKTINTKPIHVDFNNADEDYAVRLHLPITKVDLEKFSLHFNEGESVWISDGEIEEIGVLTFRDGIWVAVPVKGTLKDVDENAPYHNKNQAKKLV